VVRRWCGGGEVVVEVGELVLACGCSKRPRQTISTGVDAVLCPIGGCRPPKRAEPQETVSVAIRPHRPLSSIAIRRPCDASA
jgi:hypothetical protein